MNTLESLQALSDSELIEKVAVELMGAKIGTMNDDYSFKKKFLSFPGRKGTFFKWNPLLDWNHTMEVVEKLAENHGWYLYRIATEVGLKVGFTRRAGSMSDGYILSAGFKDTDDNQRRNICLAALTAVPPK